MFTVCDVFPGASYQKLLEIQLPLGLLIPLSNWNELKGKILGTDKCDCVMLCWELKLNYEDYN